jgi:pimeloyl-ACP methyl ester carboxylesterase
MLVGAPFGLKRRPPLQLLPLGLPLIGQRLGRHVFSNATRDGNRKFWGQVLVKHLERVDDLLLDVDVAHTRRNVESMLGLVQCIADARRLGYRRELIVGERWKTLPIPTLLILGEHDAFGSPNEGEALAAKNPNVHLVRLADAGHLPWLDDPESVVAEIERFCASSPADRLQPRPLG